MTPQDMATFRDYAKSEIVRLMKERIMDYEEIQFHILRSVDPARLQFMQGLLHGLNAAKNLTNPEWGYEVPADFVEREKPKVKPMVLNKERIAQEVAKKQEGLSQPL